MPGRSTPILLLRHGQSEWNAVRRWQGRADTPLTALGRHQARQAGEALVAHTSAAGPSSRWSFGRVVASPLSRALETARIVADALGETRTPLDVSVDERLVESDAGEWQGLTPDEIDRAYPGFLIDHRRPPSFETFESVVSRATAALHDIARGIDIGDDAPGPGDRPGVLVVAHSGLIRTIVRHLGSVDERIPNLGGVWVTASSPAPAADLRLELGDRFRPAGVVVAGVDAGGEDPGDQADDPDADRRAEG